MTIARVRVEADYPASALKNTERAQAEREKIFYRLLKAFNRQRDDAGVNHDFKRHQFFESRSRVDRRKRKESAAKLQQELLKERLLRGEKVPGAARLLKKLKEENKKPRGDKDGRK